MNDVVDQRAIRGRWTFAALMLGQASQGLTFTAFAASLASLAREFGGGGNGTMVAQFSLTVASAGIIAGAFVSGWIVERLGARRTMLWALAAFGLFGAAGLGVRHAPLLLASRMAVGFAAACMITACITEIATLYEGNARARMIGVSAALSSASALIGLNLGGVLAQAGGWRLAFLQFPLFAATGLLIAFLGFRRDSRVAAAPDGGAAGAGAWRLWPLYLFAVVLIAVMFMGSVQLPFLLPQDGVRQPTHISLIMSALTVMAVLTSFSFGVIERRLGMQGALVLGLAANAVGLGLVGAFATPPAAIVGAGLMGVSVGIVLPYVNHAVTQQAAPQARARAIGLLTAFTSLGALVNPFFAAPLTAQFGLHGLFLAAGALMATLTVGALAVRLRGRRTSAAPHAARL